MRRVTRDHTVPVEKRYRVREPAAEVELGESFVVETIACRQDYAEARDLAARDAARILARVAGVTEQEAFLYCTTVGDLRNGAVWSMGTTAPGWVKTVPVVVGLEVPLLGKVGSG